MKGNLPESIVFLGIGSNLGNPELNCLKAVERIALSRSVKLLRRSSLYRTEPVGVTEQSWFINCVVEIRTSLSPRELLKTVKGIEDDMGRMSGERWGPRIIDIDILLYGQIVMNEEDLVIPHPEMHKRRFVLVPLNEIAPYAIHPGYGISAKGLLDRLEDRSAVELIRR